MPADHATPDNRDLRARTPVHRWASRLVVAWAMLSLLALAAAVLTSPVPALCRG